MDQVESNFRKLCYNTGKSHFKSYIKRLQCLAPVKRLNFIYYQNPNGHSGTDNNTSSITYWPKYQELGEQANMLELAGTNETYNISVIQDDFRKEGISYINTHPIDFNA